MLVTSIVILLLMFMRFSLNLQTNINNCDLLSFRLEHATLSGQGEERERLGNQCLALHHVNGLVNKLLIIVVLGLLFMLQYL